MRPDSLTAFEEPVYIDSAQGLQGLCERLRTADWLTVDTEFLREKTYYPQLCLVQVATPGVLACIDPQAIDDLSPLLDVMYDPGITKVFHASSQDLEIFMQLGGRVPAPVFDTQIAAPLLGLPEQIGYANLVQELLDINLQKAHSRSDWSARPLSEKQIRYALDDVRYLCDLYSLIRQKLGEYGRLAWLESDFRRCESPERYLNDPANAWRRIKGAERLNQKQLSVLQALARWREEAAQKQNRPRNWLMRDDVLLDLSRLMPDSDEELARVRSLSERALSKNGKQLLELISKAKTVRPEPLPEWKRRTRPTPKQEALTDALSACLALIAEQYSINPAVLATRKQLSGLACGDRSLALLEGWRRAMAGEELLALLEGKRALSVTDCELRLESI